MESDGGRELSNIAANIAAPSQGKSFEGPISALPLPITGADGGFLGQLSGNPFWTAVGYPFTLPVVGVYYDLGVGSCGRWHYTWYRAEGSSSWRQSA